jgi:hypothetical protein
MPNSSTASDVMSSLSAWHGMAEKRDIWRANKSNVNINVRKNYIYSSPIHVCSFLLRVGAGEKVAIL